MNIGMPSWRREQLNVAISAGLGAGFALVLFLAISEFWYASLGQKIAEVTAITLVLLGVIRFIDPLIEHLAKIYGVSVHPMAADPANKTRHVRPAIAGIIVLISLSHAFLHRQIGGNPWGTVGLLVSTLLVPGGITYAWVQGVKNTPPRAAQFGFWAGAFLGCLVLFMAFALMAADPQQRETLGSLSTIERRVLLNGLWWSVVGLAGGLAIDKNWGPRLSVSIPACLLIAGIAGDFGTALFVPTSAFDFMRDLSRNVGWSLGLIAYPRSFTVLSVSPAHSSTEAEKPTGSEDPLASKLEKIP